MACQTICALFPFDMRLDLFCLFVMIETVAPEEEEKNMCEFQTLCVFVTMWKFTDDWMAIHYANLMSKKQEKNNNTRALVDIFTSDLLKNSLNFIRVFFYPPLSLAPFLPLKALNSLGMCSFCLSSLLVPLSLALFLSQFNHLEMVIVRAQST